MRILFIHNRYLQKGGEDTVLAAEMALLKKYGHEVDLLLFDNSVIQGVLQKALSAFRAIYNPKAYRSTRKQIQTFRPDVVHVHNYSYVASPAVFYAAKAEGVPVVHTLHNFRLICPSAILFHDGKIYERSLQKNFPIDAIRKGVFNGSRAQTAILATVNALNRMFGTYRHKVDAYLTLTEFAREKILESNLPVAHSQLLIKPNFTEDRGYRIDGRSDNFLFIGRLTEEKGVRTLLAAAKQTPFRLQILGDGPLRGEVEAAAAAHPQIQYLGFMSKEEVLVKLMDCRALLFPSLWYEGMPMVILEAFAAGTPVVASRLGSPASIITDEKQGLLFEPGNAGALAHAAHRLLMDSSLSERLGQQARQSFEQLYSPERNHQQLTGIYQQVREYKTKVTV